MVHGEVPLRHDLFQVAICERVSQIPANAQQYDHVFEMPPAEQCRPLSGHDTPYQIRSIAFATEPFRQLTEVSGGQDQVTGLVPVSQMAAAKAALRANFLAGNRNTDGIFFASLRRADRCGAAVVAHGRFGSYRRQDVMDQFVFEVGCLLKEREVTRAVK
jgi:hypothetical protein